MFINQPWGKPDPQCLPMALYKNSSLTQLDPWYILKHERKLTLSQCIEPKALPLSHHTCLRHPQCCPLPGWCVFTSMNFHRLSSPLKATHLQSPSRFSQKLHQSSNAHPRLPEPQMSRWPCVTHLSSPRLKRCFQYPSHTRCPYTLAPPLPYGCQRRCQPHPWLAGPSNDRH